MNIDRGLFNDEIYDTNADTLQVVNDNIRPSGRVRDDERMMRQRGHLLRHSLCQYLAGHDMQRPPRSEWNENNNTHVVII